jgi:hypothetical protein
MHLSVAYCQPCRTQPFSAASNSPKFGLGRTGVGGLCQRSALLRHGDDLLMDWIARSVDHCVLFLECGAPNIKDKS